MELLQGNSLSGEDISAVTRLDTYTADADRELLVHLCLSGLAGGGMYRACLTRQIEGVGPAYQSPTSVVAVSAGVTSAILSTSPLAVRNGDVVKVYAQGLAGDTDVDGVVEVFDVTAAKTGDAMALTSGERTTLAGVIWNALTSAMTTVGSVGKRIVDYLDAAISSRATPSDVQVSLAVSATEAAAVATGSLAITLHGSFDQTIESDSGENLDAADALIWAVKADRKRDADVESLALVDGLGLRYLARAPYTGSAAHGSVTLGGGTGAWEIRCQLAAQVTGELAEWAGRSLDAQVKAIFGSRTVNVWEGTARIGHQTIREV